MAGFDNGVSPPGGASYSAPLLNFANFSNWAADDPYQNVFNDQQKLLNAQRIQQGQQQADLAKTFAGGIPRDAQGNPDYQQMAAMLAQRGDFGAITQLAPLMQQQQAGNTQAWPPQGQGGAPQPGVGGPPAPSSVPARPLPQPSASAPQGDPGNGTIVDLVTARLPSQNQTTGVTIGKIAETMGVDPNAVLTPGQQRRAQGLLQRYAGGGDTASAADGGGAPSFADRFAASGDQSGSLPPSANAVSPAPKLTPPQPRAPIGAGAPPQPQGAAPAAPMQQPQGGPITPQAPLPPGFNDPQQAAQALRQRAAQIETANPKTKPKADELRAWADRIDASIAPVDVNLSTTRLDPRSGKILYQGPAAAQLAATTVAEGSPTLDADAQAYRQTGKLPPNMGRGLQGAAEARAIRNRAVEQENAEGGNPADWANRWQNFATQATGKRVLEQRAAGLSLAENEATSLIPRVREISGKVSRTNYPTLNSLILAAQKGTGGTDVIKLGIAVESLIPVYARVLKPTGQVTEGDTRRSHDILDKAWSDGQIGAALDQMQVELKSARSALDKTMSESQNRGRGKKEAEPKTDAAKGQNTTKGGLSWSVE